MPVLVIVSGGEILLRLSDIYDNSYLLKSKSSQLSYLLATASDCSDFQAVVVISFTLLAISWNCWFITATNFNINALF